MLRRKKILQDQAYANTEKLVNINIVSRLGGSHAASKLLSSGYKSQSVAALSSLRLPEMDPYALGLSVDSVGSETKANSPIPRIELDLSSPNKSSPGKSKFNKLPEKISSLSSPKKQISDPGSSEIAQYKHPLIDEDSEESALPQTSPTKTVDSHHRGAIPLNDAVLEMPSKKDSIMKASRDLSESQNWNMTPNQLYSNQSIFLENGKVGGQQSQSRLLGKSFGILPQKPEVGLHLSQLKYAGKWFHGFDLSKASREYMFSSAPFCQYITKNSQLSRKQLQEIKATTE